MDLNEDLNEERTCNGQGLWHGLNAVEDGEAQSAVLFVGVLWPSLEVEAAPTATDLLHTSKVNCNHRGSDWLNVFNAGYWRGPRSQARR